MATSATIRLIGGGGLLLLIAHRSWPDVRRHWRPLALLGVAGMGVQTLAISIGIDAGTASLGALILGLEPIFIALFGALLTHDRPSRATIAGLALGLAGVVVVSGVLTVGISGTPLVAVLALGITTISFSLYAVRLPGLTRLVGGVPAAAATYDRGRPRDPAARARRAVRAEPRCMTTCARARSWDRRTRGGAVGDRLRVLRVRGRAPAPVDPRGHAVRVATARGARRLGADRRAPAGRHLVGGTLILLGVAVATRRAAR